MTSRRKPGQSNTLRNFHFGDGEFVAAIKSVVVFCGASFGNAPVWKNEAERLGEGLADAKIRLVYGGGGVGLMGATAKACLAAGGDVIGVIPSFLTRRELALPSLAQVEITESMHSRKLRMFELADAAISFAGGLGTLDETFEFLTWKQLGLHSKPIIVCDVAGSAHALLGAIDAAVEMGFASEDTNLLYELVDGVDALIARLKFDPLAL
jgi:uncharacterized protein (TIGR00730 family)